MKKSLFAIWVIAVLGGAGLLLRYTDFDLDRLQHSLGRVTGRATGWPPEHAAEDGTNAARSPIEHGILAVLALREDGVDESTYRAQRDALVQQALDACCETVMGDLRTLLTDPLSSEESEAAATQRRNMRTLAMGILVRLPDDAIQATLKETIEQWSIATSDYFTAPLEYLNTLAIKRLAIHAMARVDPRYLLWLAAQPDGPGLNADVRSALVEAYISAEPDTPVAAIHELRSAVAPEQQRLLDAYEAHYHATRDKE